jgi:hypothetical protein
VIGPRHRCGIVGACRVTGLLLLAIVASGCYGYQTMTRAVEVDVDDDVAFRAAAATLLDDSQVFDLSDRDAGLVIGGPALQIDSRTMRTTFWITPLEQDRSYVIAQVFIFGPLDDSAVTEQRIDELVRRFRKRCLMGGDVEPFDEDDDEQPEGSGS